MAMLSAILVKDSNPTGVTDKTDVLAACSPPTRMVGSKEPRTSISLPKISAMELRYSSWVSRLMLTTCELGAAWAATIAVVIAPADKTDRDRRETARLRMRDFPLLPEVDTAQG